MMKDKKYTLLNERNQPLNSEIRVKIHWIYSKVFLLEDIIVQLNQGVKTDTEMLESKKLQLKTTQDPFGNLILHYEKQFEEEEKKERVINHPIDLEKVITVREAENNLGQRIDNALAE